MYFHFFLLDNLLIDTYSSFEYHFHFSYGVYIDGRISFYYHDIGQVSSFNSTQFFQSEYVGIDRGAWAQNLQGFHSIFDH